MRITLDLDQDLIRQARDYSGIQETAALVTAALRALIAKHTARRLAALGGSMAQFHTATAPTGQAGQVTLVDTLRTCSTKPGRHASVYHWRPRLREP
jgi:hypothetical protein